MGSLLQVHVNIAGFRAGLHVMFRPNQFRLSTPVNRRRHMNWIKIVGEAD
jgi:hypothetical protein